jgi:hypothetical protein
VGCGPGRGSGWPRAQDRCRHLAEHGGNRARGAAVPSPVPGRAYAPRWTGAVARWMACPWRRTRACGAAVARHSRDAGRHSGPDHPPRLSVVLDYPCRSAFTALCGSSSSPISRSSRRGGLRHPGSLVQIRDRLGAENMFIFGLGLTADHVAGRRREGLGRRWLILVRPHDRGVCARHLAGPRPGR